MLACLMLNISYLMVVPKFCIFSSERKVAHIYAILTRSVLHIYTVGLYNYAFHLFLVTSSPVRVHTLYWACAHSIVLCLKKLRRPCAHGQRHVCTCPSRFHSSDLCALHIYTKKYPLRAVALWWNRNEKGIQDLLLMNVGKAQCAWPPKLSAVDPRGQKFPDPLSAK